VKARLARTSFELQWAAFIDAGGLALRRAGLKFLVLWYGSAMNFRRVPMALGAMLGALSIGVVLYSSSAQSHIELEAPLPRELAMKTGPCGGSLAYSADPAKVTAYRPGDRVRLEWRETVAHPGYFRIALSLDGESFPADPPDPPPAVEFPVLAIVPKMDGQTSYQVEVTLPDEECAACTLQLIQYMQQHAPPPYYYQCADIVIDADASRDAGVLGNPGSDFEPTSEQGSAPVDGGCRCQLSAQAGSWSAAMAVSGLWLTLYARRRRLLRPSRRTPPRLDRRRR
jgi:hypothetical protein